jgi:protein-S-isoprenylcysteine O-methyltransferase Ste14
MTSQTLKRPAKTVAELAQFQRRRRLVLALLITAAFVGLLFVGSASTDHEFHEHVEGFGICVMLIAILGRTWCTLYIGGRKSSEIVRGGPYSVTRNPLYLFSAIGAVGIGAMTGSITVGLAFGVIAYVAFHPVILVEEAFLEHTFGDVYRRYKVEVPRFFPNLRLFSESDQLSVRPQVLYRTFCDGLLFLAAYPFFETIEYLQNHGTLPVLVRLF